MTQGYRLQFYQRPSRNDHPDFYLSGRPPAGPHAQEELIMLLVKGAMWEVDTRDRQAGFFFPTSWSPKAGWGFLSHSGQDARC